MYFVSPQMKTKNRLNSLSNSTKIERHPDDDEPPLSTAASLIVSLVLPQKETSIYTTRREVADTPSQIPVLRRRPSTRKTRSAMKPHLQHKEARKSGRESKRTSRRQNGFGASSPCKEERNDESMARSDFNNIHPKSYIKFMAPDSSPYPNSSDNLERINEKIRAESSLQLVKELIAEKQELAQSKRCAVKVEESANMLMESMLRSPTAATILHSTRKEKQKPGTNLPLLEDDADDGDDWDREKDAQEIEEEKHIILPTGNKGGKERCKNQDNDKVEERKTMDQQICEQDFLRIPGQLTPGLLMRYGFLFRLLALPLFTNHVTLSLVLLSILICVYCFVYFCVNFGNFKYRTDT